MLFQAIIVLITARILTNYILSERLEVQVHLAIRGNIYRHLLYYYYGEKYGENSRHRDRCSSWQGRVYRQTVFPEIALTLQLQIDNLISKLKKNISFIEHW